MEVSIIGATGATGKDLLKFLLLDQQIEKINVFVRRSIGFSSSKIVEHVVDFDKYNDWASLVRGDVAFSCMGTTIKDAGSKEKQWLIDYEYQYNFACVAAQNNISKFVLVSAAQASSNSKIFYSKMKGKLEDAISSLELRQVIIFRPSLLIRKDSDRFGERLAEKVINGLNAIGLFKSYQPLKTKDLAQAMLFSIKNSVTSKVVVFEASEIRDLANI